MKQAQCDPEVYQRGQAILIVASVPSSEIEAWVANLAAKTRQRIDWHYVGGRAVVKTLGDATEALRVAKQMITQLAAPDVLFVE